MTNAEFVELVRRAEREAARNPGGYRARVVALGALGYLFIGVLVSAAVAGLGLIVFGALAVEARGAAIRIGRELGLPLIIFVGVVAKALWVKLEAPGGMTLERADFPRLFGALDDVRARLGGPKLHRVLLDDQFNASISQVPRLGVLGWHRSYLVIGLPLLQALTVDQFVAVLAHEYGHLSGAHGKIGSWIYRIRTSWYRLMQAFDEAGGAGGFFVRRFFDWYAPYFNAYSFALARANEYEADRCAASIAGAEHLGGALVSLRTIGEYLSTDYWPRLYASADDSPAPPGGAFSGLSGRPRLGLPAERSGELLRAALDVPTDVSDTHPSLVDRLAALGVDPAMPPVEAESAAEVFLGSRMGAIVAELDRRWQETSAGWWEERHGFVQSARARLRELEVRDGSGRGAAQVLEHARLLDELEGRAAALPVYEELLELEPGHTLARCVVGLERLRAGDEAGLRMVEEAMDDDETLVVGGCQAIRDHFLAAGDPKRAEGYHHRLVERVAAVRRVEEERAKIPFDRKAYRPHDLGAEEVARLVEELRADPFPKHAYLVRKTLELSTEPIYVVGMTGGVRFTVRDDRAEVTRRIAGAVAVPYEMYFVIVEGDNKKLLPILKKVPGSKLF